MTGVGLAPRLAMGAKDVGDPQTRSAAPCGLGQAGGVRFARLTPSRSSGLLMSRIVLTATRVIEGISKERGSAFEATRAVLASME